MAQSAHKKIKFNDTYGGKIYNPVFTTFRSPEAVYSVGHIHEVVLIGPGETEKSLGDHIITSVEFKRIFLITASEIIKDLGNRASLPDPRYQFYKLMFKLYGSRKFWDGRDTLLQKITLEKVGGNYV